MTLKKKLSKMGCGISQNVIDGSNDELKSNAFMKLCINEKNPLSTQLSSYFNALMTECMYRAQGNTAGYERLLISRQKEVRVNRSRKDALQHGIGRRPLKMKDIHDIMSLFLGHAFGTLDQRKWRGSFHYVILKPAGLSATARAPNNSDPVVTFPAVAPVTSASNLPSMSQNQNPIPAQKRNSKNGKEGEPKVESHQLPQKESAFPRESVIAPATVNNAVPFSCPASPHSERAKTEVFIDDGRNSLLCDNLEEAWRLHLTGDLSFPSVNSTESLFCTSVIDFLLFVCDE